MDDDTEIRLQKIEKKLVQLRAEYAGSWALHTKEDFEMGFRQEIRNESQGSRNDLQGALVRWAVGAIVLLIGAGYVYVKQAVTDVFKDQNTKLIAEFGEKYQAELAMQRDNFEWRRFHDYGKNYVYMAQLYFDSPISDESMKTKRVIYNLEEAQRYFNDALQHGNMHASTYWELGELSYSYPIRLNVPVRIDLRKAIGNYQQAAARYTQLEIDKGWRGEAYLKIANVLFELGEQKLSRSAKDPDFLEAKSYLKKASDDLAGSKDQTSTRIQAAIREVKALSSMLPN